MPAIGGCRCRSVTYSVTGDEPIHSYICHCLNCQTWSGSAFGQHAMVKESAFVSEGAVSTYAHTTNGIRFEDVTCATCHTRLFNRNSALDGLLFLRAGTLDESQKLEPIAHIWVKRKQAWIAIPEGVASFEESPTAEQFGAAMERATTRA